VGELQTREDASILSYSDRDIEMAAMDGRGPVIEGRELSYRLTASRRRGLDVLNHQVGT
jgi:hypothetical protein